MGSLTFLTFLPRAGSDPSVRGAGRAGHTSVQANPAEAPVLGLLSWDSAPRAACMGAGRVTFLSLHPCCCDEPTGLQSPSAIHFSRQRFIKGTTSFCLCAHLRISHPAAHAHRCCFLVNLSTCSVPPDTRRWLMWRQARALPPRHIRTWAQGAGCLGTRL